MRIIVEIDEQEDVKKVDVKTESATGEWHPYTSFKDLPEDVPILVQRTSFKEVKIWAPMKTYSIVYRNDNILKDFFGNSFSIEFERSIDYWAVIHLKEEE